MFFVDSFGGNLICGVFKPSWVDPHEVKINDTQFTKPLVDEMNENAKDKQKGKQKGLIKVEANVKDVIATIKAVGAGLVKNVKVNRFGNQNIQTLQKKVVVKPKQQNVKTVNKK